MRQGFGTAFLLSSALISAGFAQSAAAQNNAAPAASSGQSGALEEIIVTATRRPELLRRVPVSVTAFSQDEMDRRSVRDMSDIANITPGVTFQRNDRGNASLNNVVIRGISSGAGTATVGVYIDDTPVQIPPDSISSTQPYIDIFDLQRVEILRGPQGTLFGAGSEGGTIRYITPTPSLTDYSVYGRAETATTENGDPTFGFGLAGGGPIVDGKLGFRADAHFRRNGGYTKSVDWFDQSLKARNSDWESYRSLRAAFRWKVNDKLAVSPSVYYQKHKINASSVYWEAFSNPADQDYANADQVVGPTNDSYYLPAVKLEWSNGDISVLSNTSYFSRENDNTFDATTLNFASLQIFATPIPPPQYRDAKGPSFLTDGVKTLTQEVRVQSANPADRLQWVLGVFYQDMRQKNSYIVTNKFLGLPSDILLHIKGRNTNKETSLYANVNFNITDALKLSAGVRASHQAFHSSGTTYGFFLGGLTPNTTLLRQDAQPVTPKLSLSYQLSDNDMVYASAAKGFRRGFGTNALPAFCEPDLQRLGLPSTARNVDPDTVWSYEVGSKNRLLDGRLSLDGSLYRIKWNNIQSSFFLPTCNFPFTGNVGDALSQGIDLAISANATDHLTLGLAFGHADAHYTTNAGIVAQGEPLPISPNTISVSEQYGFNVFDHDAYFRADYQYLSKHPDHAAGTLVDPTLPPAPASRNLDLRLGVNVGNYQLSAFATNVLNQHPAFARFRDTSTVPAALSNYRDRSVRPRTVGLTAIFRY